ncbi:UNKNOWN [Stylonychia lemnae]|uniref:Secreted protein n=1 Tax=Stylonychia lemnae TaxID=5949 RepID=A0A078A8T8_STYLE|nr:UNKNOWN [Stylonychia lemnae]|eukprot:CDW78291.1 UNKNOWN [Stylonychia lemnae]
MKQNLGLLLLFVVAFSLLSTNVNGGLLKSKKNKDINQHDKEAIKFWLSGLRGFWQGFYKEFYHGKQKLDANCLSDNSDKHIYEVLHFLSYGELYEVFQVADAIYKLYQDNADNCGVQATFQQVVNQCSTKGENKCGISNILKNGQKSVFKLVHASESIVETVKEFKPTNADEFFEDMFELGSELAETMDALLGL